MKQTLQLAVLLIAAAMFISVSGSAAVPQLINYQGRLTNSVGVPFDTTVTLVFNVCNDSLGTTNLWIETHPGVVIIDGLFQVLLGSVTPLSASVFDGSKRWLGVQLQGGPAPTALIPIVSVAYAYRAAKSDTASYALSGGSTGGGGWTDDGAAVRLTTITDNVGIGTSGPSARLDVRNANSSGLAAFIRNDGPANSDPALWVETNGNGAAIFGNSPYKFGLQGSSANSYGVYGTGSRGVYGFHIDSRHYGYLGSGNYGVYGKDSTTGVWGAIGGGNAGVVGVGQGISQVGIFGENSGAGVGIRGSSIDSSGVYGSSANKYGVSGTGTKGVFGLHLGTNHYGFLGSQNYGVYGKDSTTGVWGAIGGGNAGVVGTGQGVTQVGVFGQNNSSGVGVRGSSIDSTGVYGSSATKYGVCGTGTKGVFGLHPSSNHYGYLGSQNYGVFGKDSTTGVWGAIGGGNAGVYGEAQATNHNGVFGYNTAGGVGVRGGSVDSCGVYGSSARDWGVLGTGVRGVQGLYTTNGNYGYLGGSDYGAYGEFKDSSNYGALGGIYYGVRADSWNGYGVYSRSYNGTGIYGFSNDSTAIYADAFHGDGLVARTADGSSGYAGKFWGPVKISAYSSSESAAVLEVHGKTLLSQNGGELALSTPSQNDAGRYRIKFDNNNLGVICGSDYDNQYFTFMSAWGANRKYDAHLKVHGSATGTGSWGKYIELYHDGTDGYITTDAGHIIISPASNVGVGTSTPAYKLDVAGSCHASSFPTSSDLRLKTDIQPLTGALDKISRIRGVSFSWNERYEAMGRSTGHREIGVVAQDVEAAFPELVTKWGDEDYRAVDYGRLTAVLIEAVKELKKENESLKQRLEVLENKK